MGIYDRDYARQPPPTGGGFSPRAFRPGGFSPRLLSVTTWLIIINVGIFLIDAAVGSGVRADVTAGTAWLQGVDPDAPGLDPVVVKDAGPQQLQGGFYGYPIIDANTDALLGVRRVIPMRPLEAIGHFSTGKGFLELEVWRLVTFQFLHTHDTILHLLFNMIGLFFFGPIVERGLGSRRIFLAFYLLCGICGALLYLVLNLLGNLTGTGAAFLLFDDMYTPLIGASAGVFGILIGSAYFAGNQTMLIFGIIPMTIRTGAYLFVLLEFLHLLTGGWNQGGNAAHLGGAAAGYVFVRRSHLLRDFFDIFGPSTRRPPGTPPARARVRKPRGAAKQKDVDKVLDKVRRHGLHALTEREREILRKATEDQQG